MLLDGLSFVKTLAKFGINHGYKILLGQLVSVDLFSIFEAKSPDDYADLHAPICQNQTSFPHALSQKRSP